MDASTYSRSVHVRFEDALGLLTLSFEGTVGRADLAAARTKLLELTAEAPVIGVVLDARRSTPGYSPADLIDSVEQTLEEIAPKRCGFVSEEPRTEAMMLIETVSFPYAVRVQAFATVEAARDWVLAAA
ncbi:MAG: hypothetical protein ACFE0P_08090 [Oceanicaulis sp.]